MKLLVSLSNPTFALSPLRSIANFGFGTLAQSASSKIYGPRHFCCGTFQQASGGGIGSLLFSKALAASAFAIIAVLATYEMLTGYVDAIGVAIAGLATLCAFGFAFSAWADK